jgi:hypothetical protein
MAVALATSPALALELQSPGVGFSGGPGINVTNTTISTSDVAFSPTCDGVIVSDGQMTNSSSTLTTTSSNPFASASVGKPICVTQAASGGVGQKCGTISTYNSAGSVVLSFSASHAVSNGEVRFGTDNTTSTNAAMTAMTHGGVLQFPNGICMYGSAWSVPTGVSFTWVGRGRTYPAGPTTQSGTMLDFLTTGLATAAIPVAPADNSSYYQYNFRDMTIMGGAGQARDGGGSGGVSFVDGSWLSMDNVAINNFVGNNLTVDGGTGGGDYVAGLVLNKFWSSHSGADAAIIKHEVQNIKITGASDFEQSVGNGLELNFSGSYAAGPIDIDSSIFQRNNTGGATNTYYQIYNSSSVLFVGNLHGNYFEDDANNTPTSNQSTYWSGAEWYNNIFSVDSNAFLPLFSAAGTAIAGSATTIGHAKQCVSDSTACTSGTTYVSGGSTTCLLQNSGSAWKETGAGCY